jgi:hypothetical protein
MAAAAQKWGSQERGISQGGPTSLSAPYAGWFLFSHGTNVLVRAVGVGVQGQKDILQLAGSRGFSGAGIREGPGPTQRLESPTK